MTIGIPRTSPISIGKGPRKTGSSSGKGASVDEKKNRKNSDQTTTRKFSTESPFLNKEEGLGKTLREGGVKGGNKKLGKKSKKRTWGCPIRYGSL